LKLAEFQAFSESLRTSKKPKYRNVKTLRGGIKFDSMKEADRYTQLKLLERNGEVRNIALQVKYRCEVNGVWICTYKADFTYQERVRAKNGSVSWVDVVEDVKGYRTPVYRLKKKLMLACHGIKIRES
jgi:hypothetical protein